MTIDFVLLLLFLFDVFVGVFCDSFVVVDVVLFVVVVAVVGLVSLNCLVWKVRDKLNLFDDENDVFVFVAEIALFKRVIANI